MWNKRFKTYTELVNWAYSVGHPELISKAREI